MQNRSSLPLSSFEIVVVSGDSVLVDNIVSNYTIFEQLKNKSQNLKDKNIIPQIKDQNQAFKNRHLSEATQLVDIRNTKDYFGILDKIKKIDILIVDKSNLKSDIDNFKINFNAIDFKTNKIINLSGELISDREIMLNPPIKMLEMLEIIYNHINTDEFFEEISGGLVYSEQASIIRSCLHDIKLTAKENAIIKYLLNSNDTKIAKQELLEQVWKYAPNTETSTLETHLYKLKQKLPHNLFMIEGNSCFFSRNI